MFNVNKLESGKVKPSGIYLFDFLWILSVGKCYVTVNVMNYTCGYSAETPV